MVKKDSQREKVETKMTPFELNRNSSGFVWNILGLVSIISLWSTKII